MISQRKPTFVEKRSGDFVIEGVLFKVIVGGNYRARNTDSEGVVLLKPWTMMEQELNALGDLHLTRMLEFGIFRGGSAVLWPMAVDLMRYVGIDRQPQRFEFPESVKAHDVFTKMRLYWETSQDDEAALQRIIDTEFDAPLDLVIDDASHQYALSKRSFEICFPKLHPGGLYLLEDWAWSHHPPSQDASHMWANQPALTNLVFDLVMIAGSRPDIISCISVYPGFVIAKRGQAQLDSNFTVDSVIRKREYDRMDWAWGERLKDRATGKKKRRMLPFLGSLNQPI